jgi:hypothetical protein
MILPSLLSEDAPPGTKVMDAALEKLIKEAEPDWKNPPK